MTDKAILHEKDLISCLVKILDPYIKDINGTGFFIHPNGYILTCYHVIKLYIDNEIKEVLLLYKDQKLKAKICYEYCFKEADISILKVIEQSKIKIYYPILDIHNKWEIDDRIISYGFPTDNFEFEKSGIGITGAIGGYTKISGVDVIQINDISLHYLSPGYSGSPVIHLKSKKVIGLIYAKIEGEKDEEIEKIKKFQAFFVPLWPIFKYFSELRDFHAHKFIITDQVINLSEYRQYILTQLKDFQKSQYTVLDVDPMVLNVDRNLTPISNFSIPIIEAFKNYDRFIIIGEAGAGKTASMYFIAQLVADDNTKYKELLDIPSEYCIYIKLSRFKFRKDTDKISYKKIISLIGETLYIGRASKIPLSLETVENFLSKYDILFLFDGLNEVQYEIRNLCLEAIDDLARKHPKNRYVITTRLYGFLPQEEWNYVKIKKLSNQQVMEFLMRYTNKEMAQNLFQNVFDSRNQLLRIPLFLSLIIDMFNKYPNKFPSLFGSRSNIIAKYSERLLLRDDREKHSSVKINFYMDQLRNVQLHNMLYILAEIIQELGQHLKKEEVL